MRPLSKLSRPTLRALALELCKGKPAAVRKVCLQFAAAFDDRGTSLTAKLSNSYVPGKGGDRERTARMEWQRRLYTVLIKLASHADIVTGDVCRGTDREFYGLRVDTLAEWYADQIGPVSQRTIERVVEVFNAEGIFRTWQRSAAKPDGSVRGKVAVRKLSIEALLQLVRPGLVAWWDRKRRKASAERSTKARLLNPEETARQELQRVARENAGESRRPARIADGMRRVDGFTSGAGLAALIKGDSGPPEPQGC